MKLKNTWLDEMNPYNGINVQIEAPNGQIFELQFHTPESFELKNGILHDLYEQQRCADDIDYVMELFIKMKELSDQLIKPSGIENIQDIP